MNTLAAFRAVPSGAAVGAEIRGVDLSAPVPEAVKAAQRRVMHRTTIKGEPLVAPWETETEKPCLPPQAA